MASIPCVDMSRWIVPATRTEFVRELGDGLEQLGFVMVTGHGVPVELLQLAYARAREVFALHPDVKARYETPTGGRQRGYTGLGVEHAKDTLVPDLKEFWHVGRDLGAGHPLHLSGDVPPNIFPAEVPAFQPAMARLFRELESFAGRLLEAVESYLELETGFFAHLTRDGNSVLRVINYPDVGAGSEPGAVRAAPHEDINLMTVLPASTQPGLEVMTRDGRWLSVNPPPNVMICDTGDMMALLTANRLPATTHRVVNPAVPDGGRLSMPFFLHPHPDALLAPMVPGFARAVRARDFFHERLRQIGVEPLVPGVAEVRE
ncbi:MAG: isopenicillin N synthase family oxygenase [Deltaproteobacteria bacterium]|nr:isopenicillin N synthase family oxygenase [Deltaproteobacteria bacterium]